MMNEEIDKGIVNSSKSTTLTDKHSSWHLDQLEVEKLKQDFKALREQVLQGDEQAAKEQLMGKIHLPVSLYLLISVSFEAQFDALNAELEHRRREQIEMKCNLQERVMQHENESDDVITADAIERAYQSQKQINKYDRLPLLVSLFDFLLKNKRMLELELEQCRTSYQREYERVRERLTQLENENIDLYKSIDENTVDDSIKQQITEVVDENLVRCCFDE